MKFSTIDSLPYETVKQAKKVFRALILELCIRKNNEHVGSGLGGNNFQATVFMGMKHKLSSVEDITIKYDSKNNIVIWGGYWLSNFTTSNGLIAVRHKLDEIFSKIVESNKVMAIALEALVSSHAIRETFENYKESFPELNICLQGKYWAPKENLSWSEKYILGAIICQTIANELDQNNTANIETAGSSINEFPDEIILLVVRRYIQIERLIKFSLDRSPSWAPFLERITKSVEF